MPCSPCHRLRRPRKPRERRRRDDRVTEVGIVRVDDDARESANGARSVDPECSIPPAIQALTGITNAMVREAPTFSQIADAVADARRGCIFVAHNARFDYGFLKHEFARLGSRALRRRCSAPSSCRGGFIRTRAATTSTRSIARHALRGRRSPSRPGRRAHPLGVRAGALSRQAARRRSMPRRGAS